MDRAADHRILPMDEAPTHLIRDRDARYGQAVTRRLAAIGIRDRPTAPRVPGSHRDLQRGPFASSPQGLCCLLQPCSVASGVGQGCAAGSSRPAVRRGHCKAHPRRASSRILSDIGIREEAVRADEVFGKDSHKQTHAPQQIEKLFDHLVARCEQHQQQGDPEPLLAETRSSDQGAGCVLDQWRAA